MEDLTPESILTIRQAEFEMRRALMALRLEVAPAIADEIVKRFDAYVAAVGQK